MYPFETGWVYILDLFFIHCYYEMVAIPHRKVDNSLLARNYDQVTRNLDKSPPGVFTHAYK